MGKRFRTAGAVLAAAALVVFGPACGGSGEPGSVAAFNQFTQQVGGGAGPGGGPGQFRAVGYNATGAWVSVFGSVFQIGPGIFLGGQPSREVHIFCESFQMATGFRLLESPPGQNNFTPVNGMGSPLFPALLTNGAFFVFDEGGINSQIDYRVEALDAGGAVLGASNVIQADFVNANLNTFPISEPPVQPLTTPFPTAPGPVTCVWAPPSVGTIPVDYTIMALENVSGGDLWIGLTPATSFNTTNGNYLEPPQTQVWNSGSDYLIMIVGYDITGWQAAADGGAYTVQ